MIVNNFEQISKLLTFESEDDFYHLQILMRKKDSPEHLREQRNNARCLKTYYIKSREHLFKKQDEIISLCNMFTARAYINLNRKSFKRASLYMLSELSDRIIYEQYDHVYRAYDTVIGQANVNVGEKRWIIDVDSKEMSVLGQTAEAICKCQSSRTVNDEGHYDNIYDYIPTVNGWHIITYPFNIKQIEPFQCTHPFDIQKNNPTLLYFKKK